MRLPFLRPKPQPGVEPLRPAAKRTERARGPVAADGGGAEVAVARTRARRRLVGALVLLVVGVVGFPVLFETTPRPLPLDIPIELPRREGGAAEPALSPGPSRPLPVRSLPAAAGPALAAPEPAPEPAAQAAPAGATAPVAAAAAPASVPVPVPRVSASAPRALSAVATVTIPAAASAPRAAVPASRIHDGARAAALLAGTASVPAASAASAASGRFVVQAGAYSDAGTLRDARAKVEKLGLKTYTQVIENDAGKRTRVRLGPFATRQEADTAAAQVRRAGLKADVLAL